MPKSNEVTTVKGRVIIAPKIRVTSHIVAKNDSIKADIWLLNEAKEEVKCEPSCNFPLPGSPQALMDYQSGLLNCINPKKMTEAERAIAWGILTGNPDAQPVFELVTK